MNLDQTQKAELKRLLTRRPDVVIFHELHENIKGIISPCGIDLMKPAPSIGELTDLRRSVEVIDQFFRFTCELNTIEIKIRQTLREL